MKGSTPQPPRDAHGFVLAGGRSSRMGVEKALVEVGGRPLIVHALRSLQAAGLPASIAGARSDLSPFAPVVPDRQPDLGPLSGICAALSAAARQWVVILPVDLPLMAPGLLSLLLRHAEMTGSLATLASINGFPQTFPAVLRREALPALQDRLLSGRRGCFQAIQAAAQQCGQSISTLPVEVLLQCGQLQPGSSFPATRWFQNVNTPQDLERVSVFLSRSVA